MMHHVPFSPCHAHGTCASNPLSKVPQGLRSQDNRFRLLDPACCARHHGIQQCIRAAGAASEKVSKKTGKPPVKHAQLFAGAWLKVVPAPDVIITLLGFVLTLAGFWCKLDSRHLGGVS